VRVNSRLTLHVELDLRAVVQRLAAVRAAVGQAQLPDGQPPQASILRQRVPGSRLDNHALAHPLHLPRVQAHLRLQDRLSKLLPHHRIHPPRERHLGLCGRAQTDKIELIYYCITLIYLHFCVLYLLLFYFTMICIAHL